MASPHGYLLQYPVKTTLPAKPIVSCRPDDLAKEVLESLVEHRIQAMPVLSGNKEFVGIVDTTDFVRFMVRIHGETMDHPPVYRFAKEWLELHDAKIHDITSGSKRKPESVSINSNLAEAAKKLTLPGVHRVVVLDKDNNTCVNFITQFFVLDLIYKHVKDLSPDFLTKKVKDFSGYKAKEILKVNKIAKPIEAFRFLFHQNVSAVPIVDNDGTLLGTISEKDIRVILDQNNFPQILYNETSETFVQKIRNSITGSTEGKSLPEEPLSITENTAMAEVIQLLHDHKTHRLWVVDGHKKVIGVIALKDILEEFNEFK